MCLSLSLPGNKASNNLKVKYPKTENEINDGHSEETLPRVSHMAINPLYYHLHPLHDNSLSKWHRFTTFPPHLPFLPHLPPLPPTLLRLPLLHLLSLLRPSLFPLRPRPRPPPLSLLRPVSPPRLSPPGQSFPGSVRVFAGGGTGRHCGAGVSVQV